MKVPMKYDKRILWLSLPLAGIMWFFAGGRWVVGVAAWLAPVFMLRWFRGRRAVVAFPLAVIVAGTANFFAWRGIADVMMPTGFFVLFSAAAAFVYLTPYIADRALSRRLDGFSSTLVFPAAVVTLEFALSVVSPLGTWNAVAYTQIDDLALIQLSSLTGIYGVSFIVTWFGAVANWAWEKGFVWATIKRGVTAYALVITAALIFGGARLAFSRPAETVRVAGIISRPFFLSAHPEMWAPLLAGRQLERDEAAAFRKETAAINEDLLARSRREARAGAKIVLWGEAGAQILARDEQALVSRGRVLAREENIYFGMALATLKPGRPKPVENKFILFDPRGEVVWEYLKYKPVPGPEAAITRRGNGNIPTTTTPCGRLAGVICYDMDFPGYIRKAGCSRADIMLVPAHDWRELGGLHGDLAVFRAVENGFSLFRPDNDAVSVATDYLGRPLAVMDYFATKDPVIVANLPTHGTSTLYTKAGDAFAWLVIAGFGVLSILAIVKKAPDRK
jgi:apolipoprotein N-acyltransferase